MNFKINQIDFQKVVRSVMPAVGSEGKSDIKSFRFIQIAVVEGGVVLSATNGEMMLKCSSVAESLSPGCVGVAGKALMDIVELLPSGNVTVAMVGEGRLQIKAGRSAFHLPVLAEDVFPILPAYEGMAFVEVEDFFEDMDYVNFACSSSLDKPQLQGVYMNQGEVVGLDGHRLAIRKTKWGFEKACIIPSDGIVKIKKTFSENKIGVCVTENEIHFSQSGKFGTLRLIRGHAYPDYPKVLPAGECLAIKISASALLNSIRMVTVVADKQNSIVMSFRPGQLYLYSETPESGKAEDTLEIECTGEVSIGMNAAYLKQALEHVEGNDIVLELRGSNKALTIREEHNLHVIMPKRI